MHARLLSMVCVYLGQQSSVHEHNAADADWQAGHHGVTVAGAKEIEHEVRY